MIWFQTAKAVGHLGSPFGRADQMTTGPKVLSAAAERQQEPLGLPRRGEAFHHRFPDPGRLRGVLGPAGEVLPAAMSHRRPKRAGSDLIAGQLVGDNHPRHLTQALEQVTEKPLGRHRVAARGHQDVEHLAVLWSTARHRSWVVPLIVTNTSSKCHLSPGAGSPPTSPGSVVRPERRTPGPDRLVADPHTAGKHQLLNVTQAHRETVIQPHRVPDDLDRIPVAGVFRAIATTTNPRSHHTRSTT